MVKPEIRALIEVAAKGYGLDPDLVEAEVMQESSGKVVCSRYEDAFWNHYIVPMKLEFQEGKDRATSWGLMQIMLQVAREYGFAGTPQELMDPTTNLDYGCKHLRNKIRRYGRVDKGIAAYNAGSAIYKQGTTTFVNQAYVDSVMNYLKQIKTERR